MIQNQHQYQVTQNKLKDLERGLVELEKIKDTLHPRQWESGFAQARRSPLMFASLAHINLGVNDFLWTNWGNFWTEALKIFDVIGKNIINLVNQHKRHQAGIVNLCPFYFIGFD